MAVQSANCLVPAVQTHDHIWYALGRPADAICLGPLAVMRDCVDHKKFHLLEMSQKISSKHTVTNDEAQIANGNIWNTKLCCFGGGEVVLRRTRPQMGP